jgi:hypothetical protein
MNVIKRRVDLTHRLEFQRSVNLVSPEVVVFKVFCESIVTVE